MDPLNRASIRRHLKLSVQDDEFINPYLLAVEDGGSLQTDAATAIAAADAALLAWDNAQVDEDTDVIKAGTAEFAVMQKIGLLERVYNRKVADMARTLNLSGLVDTNSGGGYLTGFMSV